MTAVRITVDTNLINGRGDSHGMNTLERWGRDGKVQLVSTPTLRDELPDVRADAGCPTPRYLAARAKADLMHDVAEPLLIDYGRIDEAYLIEMGQGPEFVELARIVFPNGLSSARTLSRRCTKDEYDVLALYSHAHSGADFFVTNDKHHILRVRDELRDEFGILVMSDDELVDYLASRHGWDR